MNHPPTPLTDRPAAQPHGRSWMIWPAMVVALLAGQIVVCAVMISQALGRSSVAVEPDYYQRAVSWDQDRAALAASEALGWSTAWEPIAAPDLSGHRLVSFTLRDATGEPITAASVTVVLFHHARSGDRIEMPMVHGGAGRYAAALPMDRSGRWTLRVRAAHDADLYHETRQVTLDPTGGSALP